MWWNCPVVEEFWNTILNEVSLITNAQKTAYFCGLRTQVPYSYWSIKKLGLTTGR